MTDVSRKKPTKNSFQSSSSKLSCGLKFKIRNSATALWLLAIQAFFTACHFYHAEDLPRQEIALNLIRKSNCIELFTEGLKVSLGENYKYISGKEINNLESLFLYHYLEEWNTDSLKGFSDFFESESGREYTASLTAFSKGRNYPLSESVKKDVDNFFASKYGKYWIEGIDKITARVISELGSKKYNITNDK